LIWITWKIESSINCAKDSRNKYKQCRLCQFFLFLIVTFWSIVYLYLLTRKIFVTQILITTVLKCFKLHYWMDHKTQLEITSMTNMCLNNIIIPILLSRSFSFSSLSHLALMRKKRALISAYISFHSFEWHEVLLSHAHARVHSSPIIKAVNISHILRSEL